MPSVASWMRALPLAAALIVFPLSTSPAEAQSSSSAGPTLSAASVGARRVSLENSLDSREAATPLQVRGGRGQSAALMVVGGIAFVAGILVGGGAGAIMMVGGAAAGLYGLYLYLQ